MVLKERSFAPSFFYPSTHISTRPKRFLPAQMTGRQVSAKSYDCHRVDVRRRLLASSVSTDHFVSGSGYHKIHIKANKITGQIFDVGGREMSNFLVRTTTLLIYYNLFSTLRDLCCGIVDAWCTHGAG